MRCLIIRLAVGMQGKAHGLGMIWTVSPPRSECRRAEKVEPSKRELRGVNALLLEMASFSSAFQRTSGELEGKAIELN